MLTATPSSKLTDLDRLAFQAFVPEDHYLRQVARYIDFERFRPRLQQGYSATMGRPPIDPSAGLFGRGPRRVNESVHRRLPEVLDAA